MQIPQTSGEKRSTISSQARWSPARARRTRSTMTGSSRMGVGPRVAQAHLGDGLGRAVARREERGDGTGDLAGGEGRTGPRRPAVEVDQLLVALGVPHEDL